jgi:hypothetical protein
MLTTAQPGLVAAAAEQRDGYEEMARQLRTLAMTLNAMAEDYEACPQSLDGAISAGGESGHVETVIMHVYELMKHRVLGEESPLRANPEVWASFQGQQPEFIAFFGSARIALEMYGEILRMYRQVSSQAAYGARPGELDGVRRDKHVQVEERRHCITAIREFSGKFTAMLAVL